MISFILSQMKQFNIDMGTYSYISGFICMCIHIGCKNITSSAYCRIDLCQTLGKKVRKISIY